jgi:hypothetical protein
MPGPVPGIHVLSTTQSRKDVDGRDKPGHDDGVYFRLALAQNHRSFTTTVSPGRRV